MYNFHKHTTESWRFVLAEFPKHHVETLKRLVYPDWYASCFSQSFESSAMWGHYANGHRGMCLQFVAEETGTGDLSLPLDDVVGYGGRVGHPIEIKGYRQTVFQTVKYSLQPVSVDFFRSLGKTPRQELIDFWYTDDIGNLSSTAKEVLQESKDWRQNYWSSYKEAITRKDPDWSYEKESRLIIDGMFHNRSEVGQRTLRYDFQSLSGIIFGISTTVADRMKAMSIIDQKCAEAGRNKFSFLQAYRCSETNAIKAYNLNVLKLSTRS